MTKFQQISLSQEAMLNEISSQIQQYFNNRQKSAALFFRLIINKDKSQMIRSFFCGVNSENQNHPCRKFSEMEMKCIILLSRDHHIICIDIGLDEKNIDYETVEMEKRLLRDLLYHEECLHININYLKICIENWKSVPSIEYIWKEGSSKDLNKALDLLGSQLQELNISDYQKILQLFLLLKTAQVKKDNWEFDKEKLEECQAIAKLDINIDKQRPNLLEVKPDKRRKINLKPNVTYMFTPKQCEILDCEDSVVVIIGQAGAGKTILITAKIVQLLTKISPNKIIVLIPEALKQLYENYIGQSLTPKERLHIKIITQFFKSMHIMYYKLPYSWSVQSWQKLQNSRKLGMHKFSTYFTSKIINVLRESEELSRINK